MSIETRPAYILDRKKNTMKRANVNKFGDEVIGHAIFITDDYHESLVPYDANELIFSPSDGGNSLDEKEGKVARFEGLRGIDSVIEYDVTNPAKYPVTPSALRGKRDRHIGR